MISLFTKYGPCCNNLTTHPINARYSETQKQTNHQDLENTSVYDNFFGFPMIIMNYMNYSCNKHEASLIPAELEPMLIMDHAWAMDQDQEVRVWLPILPITKTIKQQKLVLIFTAYFLSEAICKPDWIVPMNFC